MSTTLDLQECFAQHFEIVQATTPQLLSESYRLRYQVYCLEKRFPGFEPENYPNGEESDEYDERSIHNLLIHRPSGEIIGMIRLILSDSKRPDSPFPVETHLNNIDDLLGYHVDRRQIAEVSRFILSADCTLSNHLGSKSNESSDNRSLPKMDISKPPHPILGLIKAGIQSSWDYDLRYWLCAMEPSLDKRLRHYGIALSQVGSTFDYHGAVNLYWAYIPLALYHCHKTFPHYWSFYTNNGQIWPIDPSQFPIGAEAARS
jgi:N-acyl amino acid synthase of PEP-CTERM/exosortase system